LKPLRPFDIAFVGLSNGIHEFFFELDNDFFACFEGSEIIVSELKGKLVMNKKSNMLDLDFFITGRIELECDRCLEPFWYNLDTSHSLYVKFGLKKEEQSDDVVIIPSTDSHFDVSQYFYEFAMLDIPVKKVHDGQQTSQLCNPSVLEKLEKYLLKDSASDDEDKKPSDSRWDALRDLKFN
jgi:uncharacterized metal-binding protein YceD (DUF177 family)